MIVRPKRRKARAAKFSILEFVSAKTKTKIINLLSENRWKHDIIICQPPKIYISEGDVN